ncbi:MAG: hypothetical protein K2L82_05225 [Lachnospiraceae bacterium]|nr:hypothetical protein [Lachnospiraceae bacterium]
MSSSEEYLDSLLRSLTEGDSHTDEASAFDTQEVDAAGMTNSAQEADIFDSSAPGTSMSMNEIETMFASMGETAAEETANDEMLQGDSEMNESSLFDELTLESEEPTDGVALESDESLDGLVLDDSFMPDELALGEESAIDGVDLDETLLDDLVLDESMMPEETVPEEDALGEMTLGEEESSDEMELDETLLDDLVLDESLMPEETAFAQEETLEESSDDLTAEESGTDDFALLEEMLPNESENDNVSDDLALSDLDLDDLNLDDLGLEDSGQMEENTDVDEMSVDEFALEESGEDDDDLSALLAGMGSDDDLAEINDLLEKADQGMSDDDDMLAMLGDVSEPDEESGENYDFFAGAEVVEGDPENIREITPEELEERENSKKSKKEKKKAEKERKKKEKQERKKKKKGGQEESDEESKDDELNDLLESMDVTGGKPKKQGFFGRLLEALLDEDEDDEFAAGGENEAGSEIANLSDENKELLAELKAEDKKNAKKKDKKEKKGKKGKNKEGEAGAEGDGEEGAAKAKKPKKEKKKKKEKEKNIEDELKAPEKKLSKKKVSSIFLFCATIAACIILLSTLLPTQIEKQEARVAYDYGQYEQVYELLYGKELSEEDDALLQKSSIILQTRRKLESYENYTQLGMPLEALNALMEGVNRYHNLRDEAELYRVSDELYDVYEQILSALTESYGVSESEALDILSSGDDVTYSQRLRSIVYGEVLSNGEDDLPEVKQDVLPEEEEIIDRLQDTEEAEETDELQQTAESDESAPSGENDEVMQAEEETLGE